MDADYTFAIAATTALVLLLTGMTAFLLTRPSDLAPSKSR
jgi:hypothetical protein